MELNVDQMIMEGDELIVPMSVEYRNDITTEDFNELCRLCGNCSNQLMPIFSGDGADHNLSEKITQHLPISVSLDDLLPSNICYQCASTLISWHELYYACKDADQRLREVSSRLIAKDERTEGQVNALDDDHDYNDEPTTEVETAATISEVDVSASELSDFELKTELFQTPSSKEEVPTNDRCTSLNSKVISISSSDFKGNISCVLPAEETVDTRMQWISQASLTHNSSLETKTVTAVQLTTIITNSDNQKLQPDCDKCGRKFLNAVSRVVHANEQRIIVANPQVFNILNKLVSRTPSETSPSEEVFECDSCHKKFSQKNLLEAHISDVHMQVKKFKCDICHWKYRTECDLATHRSVHSLNEKLICRLCGGRSRFPTRRPYENISESLNLIRCLCSSTSETFPMQKIEESVKLKPSARLAVNKLVFKGNEDDGSGKVWWKENVEATASAKKSDKVNMTKCEQCDKECGSYYFLKKHKRTHNARVYCDICGKMYLKHYLKTHMLIHSNVKTFACDKCGKTFAQKSSLRSHQLLEDNVKKFMCNICGMQFVLSSRMQWHMKSHMEAKPFKCTDCGKEFGYVWQLRQHSVKHSDVRKYICEYCSKSYKTMKHLRQHWHHYPSHRKDS